KCGQRCTGIRRAIVPAHLLEDVQIALSKALAQTTIGDPQVEGVRMGALAGKTQVAEVRSQVEKLLKETNMVYGNLNEVTLIGANAEHGAFLSPMLLVNERPLSSTLVHEVEAFGPVCTLMPYANLDEAIEIAKMGKGSLCSSIVTYDNDIAKQFVVGAASHHGRILVLNRDCAKENTGHGSPLPLLTHGGPGRAGGGEEMGGMRGVLHYLQRCAIQGSPTTLTEITSIYQYGGQYKDPGVHPFRKYFEELHVGETVITHNRTITESDIVQFANVSWDHFYAHTDVTSLEGTTFTQRVAHGYFVLSMAAGLFVDPGKGPVLLNYGLEECRFTKPVYAGMTLGVRLTVKEKLPVDPKEEDVIHKGIVKFLVDVFDETGETVAIATILTMVQKKVSS
ncbi:MAG TPA: aldehyde dehydrogenase family protein, partial [Saprospiraceae bacterium]|nr:aldehyde dehydrogenase family protein [Saprospiraceae bacterium]